MKHYLYLAGIIGLFLIPSISFAGGNNNGPSCTGNSCNTTNYNTTNNTTNNQGGQGGTGIGVGVGFGQGGNAIANSNNSNKNSNSNTNVLGQKQGQGQWQGQGQFQGQSTNNANNSSQSTTVNVAGDTTNYEAPDIPVSTAIGPSMSPSGQCMGVATGGVQGMSFGVSLGKSYESKPCNQRELARMFLLAGERTAAMQVLCSHEGAEVTDLCKGLKEPEAPTVEAAESNYKPVTFLGL